MRSLGRSRPLQVNPPGLPHRQANRHTQVPEDARGDPGVYDYGMRKLGKIAWVLTSGLMQ